MECFTKRDLAFLRRALRRRNSDHRCRPPESCPVGVGLAHHPAGGCLSMASATCRHRWSLLYGLSEQPASGICEGARVSADFDDTRELQPVKQIKSSKDGLCSASPTNYLPNSASHSSAAVNSMGRQASDACESARPYLVSGAAAGEHLADQLLLPFALAGGGSFTAEKLNLHARTNIDVIAKFLPVEFRVTQDGAVLASTCCQPRCG
jgi:hypothetical protein